LSQNSSPFYKIIQVQKTKKFIFGFGIAAEEPLALLGRSLTAVWLMKRAINRRAAEGAAETAHSFLWSLLRKFMITSTEGRLAMVSPRSGKLE